MDRSFKPTYQDLWSLTSGIKLAKNVQEMAVCARSWNSLALRPMALAMTAKSSLLILNGPPRNDELQWSRSRVKERERTNDRISIVSVS